ncbi:fructose/H+ symporter 1 [Sesbania bispinosa]|nr:fructose/H+ symporter 1 [Sesbania bispinosa]
MAAHGRDRGGRLVTVEAARWKLHGGKEGRSWVAWLALRDARWWSRGRKVEVKDWDGDSGEVVVAILGKMAGTL